MALKITVQDKDAEEADSREKTTSGRLSEEALAEAWMETVKNEEKQTEGKDNTAQTKEKAPKNKGADRKMSRKWIIPMAAGITAAAGGAVMFAVPFVLPQAALPDLGFPNIPSSATGAGVYSNLTGMPVESEAAKTAPTYCVQIPNGIDGARPQAGLDEAGVVFEAIAEAGITRFAAIYQAPESAVIGPIRSLRIYYLEWDTPFDCTIVHAGGADDALKAVANGGYRDLSEDYAYMYRGTASTRLWNNLFTTGAYLTKSAKGATSDVHGFTRMTPEVSERARINGTVAERLVITEPASGNTSATKPEVTEVTVKFGNLASFNVRYRYDAASNTYARSYANGDIHSTYDCPASDLGKVDPESRCKLSQVAPVVVVAIKVREQLAAYDNYHEDVTTVGSGEAYVFQNGMAIRGTWQKTSVKDQIRFYDSDGAEIALAPGQTFVEAVPQYGSVDYK